MGNALLRVSGIVSCFPIAVGFAVALRSSPVHGQIVPDLSLPDPSTVRRQVDANGVLLQQIEGGTTRGTNLFHSFRTFNIPAGSTARFANSAAIANIFTRVTGGDISNIDGRLQTNGTANFFFLNPNGILFGPEAQLAVGGSFVASSAERLIFADGVEFSATDPEAMPLLTVSAPIGLGFGATPGPIASNARVTLEFPSPIQIPEAAISLELSVPTGETLGLIGGSLNLVGGRFLAPEGRIKLGSVATNAVVGLDPAADLGISFDFGSVAEFGDIRVTNVAQVDASGDRGGAIAIAGRNVTIAGGAQVVTATFATFTGNDITVDATESLQVLGTTTIPGLFDLNLSRAGILVPQFSAIANNTAGPQGNAGNIRISTRRLALRDGARISAIASPGEGFDTGLLPAGRGGDITISATERVDITGFTAASAVPGVPLPQVIVEANGSSFLTTLVPTFAERAGDITIETGTLRVGNSAVIGSLSTGTGDGGNITISARDAIIVEGVRPGGQLASRIDASTSGLLLLSDLLGQPPSNELPALLRQRLLLGGRSGDINLSARELTVRDGGVIITGTSTSRSGGRIGIAAEEIEISGPSQILANSAGVARAGDIEIATDRLRLRDGGTISVAGGEPNGDLLGLLGIEILGTGPAGTLQIEAEALELDGGRLAGRTPSEQGGGSLFLQADNILLRNGSRIETDATGAASGGNITIDAETLVGLPQMGNSDITANAEAGSGGSIALDVTGLFGFDVRSGDELRASGLTPAALPTNDITAFSQDRPNIDRGTVILQSPEVDPAKALAQFDVALVDATQEIVRSCSAERGAGLAIAGRGSLPPKPTSLYSGTVIWADLGEVAVKPSQNQALEEAQGWQTAEDGTVALVANLPTDAEAWLDTGRYQYRSGDFGAAARTWERAATEFARIGDRDNIIRTASNLALAYAQLGDWPAARQTLAVAEQASQQPADNTPVATPHERLGLSAQVAMARGTLAWGAGQMRAALAAWEEAAEAYTQIGDRAGKLRSQLNRAQGYGALGLSLRQLQLLETLIVDPGVFPELAAARWQGIGDARRALGQLDGAREALQKGLTLAEQYGNRRIVTAGQLSLGATWQQSGDLDRALKLYRQAATIAPSSLLRIQAWLHQLQGFLAAGNSGAAQRLWPVVAQEIDTLPLSHASLYARLHLAATLAELLPVARQQEKVEPLLAATLVQAQNLGDETATIWTLGELGHLAERTENWETALGFARQAIVAAESTAAPELLYRLQWQLGRALIAVERDVAAIAAYDDALTALRSLRRELAKAGSDAQSAFQTEIDPLYREYASLLLQPDRSNQIPQANLQKARQAIEDLRLAELDDFFQDDCSNATPVAIDSLDPGTAVIYPIVLPDRLAVIVGIAGQPLHYHAVELSAADLERAIDEFSASMLPFYRGERQQPGRQLYDWLIRPAETWLARAETETLVVVPDGRLRDIAFAALTDGDRYLIENFSLVLSPGLTLLPPQPFAVGEASILTAGLSEARQGFTPLPAVTQELAAVAAVVPDNRQLYNQTFTNAGFTQALEREPATILHLATHGQFGSRVDDTFILTWDERVGIVELGELLERHNRNFADSLELLVLSACSTATGDERATLGLAGVAVRSGARSTLAGLWPLQDAAAAAFVTEFYQALVTPGTSRAQAMRQAQLTLMRNPKYTLPYVWAPFVLVGNWL